MNESLSGGAGARTNYWRIAAWSAAACLVMLPLVAMQFTDEVYWTAGDFMFATIAIGTTGLAFEFALRVSPNLPASLGYGLLLAGALLMVWINAAVGIIGSAANDANLLYGVVLLAGVLVGALGRFRPAAMVRAALMVAITQTLLTLIAILAGLGAPEASALELVMVNGFFMPFWLGAAFLFHLSARGHDDDAGSGPAGPAPDQPRRHGPLFRLGFLLLVALGGTILIFKVTADGEPGAVPLIMIVAGGMGWVLARRGRSRQD